MKRITHFVGVLTLAASMLILTNTSAMAGRIGGPTSTIGSVAIGGSVYYDISFAAGERAVVMINGAGNAMIQVFMYDADGHVVTSTGLADRKVITLAMDVYRAGAFRVEIRNLGNRDCSFLLTTN
jgi:hypothetical protein